MISIEEFRDRYLEPFAPLDWIYAPERGFVVWRPGTGGNSELLHITAAEIRKGHGRWLFYQMLERLKEQPPYHSVFGFTAVSNRRARAFYEALGFNTQEVGGIYRTGPAALFWQSYERLLELKDEHEGANRLEP